MIIWINGAFGAGKTTTAYELHRRISGSYVYDPENAGYFLRKNMPKRLWKNDFQDHEAWRAMNVSMLQTLSREFQGVIIVPMTIVNPQYFDEIIQRLRDEHVDIRHFALLASKETLLKRLRSRGDGQQSWPAQQIERCISSLSLEMFQTHLYTDQLTTEEIINQIAQACGIELQPDNRGKLRKKMDRLITQIKHIRI